MSIWKSLIVTAALLFAGGGVALAAQSSTQSTANKTTTATSAIHEEVGTVSSISNSELVLSHMVKGKEENTTFKLDTMTKKDGKIDKGAHVAVSYKDENHERVATEVKVEAKK
jgi:hypothetical protein